MTLVSQHTRIYLRRAEKALAHLDRPFQRRKVSQLPKDQVVEENLQLRKLLLELQCGTLDTKRHELRVQYNLHKLTGAEERLFWLLFEAKGRPLLKEPIFQAMYWEHLADQPDIKIVDVFICKLRKKLRNLKVPFRIETIWGRGYLLCGLDEEVKTSTEALSVQEHYATPQAEVLHETSAVIRNLQSLAKRD